MSIKPKWLEAIKEGRKRYEYRRALWMRDDVDTILLYCTKPVGMVVGEVRVGTVYHLPPRELWERTGEASGMTRETLEEYFRGRWHGYAIEVTDARWYEEPRTIGEVLPGRVSPPQFFYYIPEQEEK